MGHGAAVDAVLPSSRMVRPHGDSDNLILMKDLSATDAARRFSDVLDAVEHRGESFAIVRRGHPVAYLQPVVAAPGRVVKAFLSSHRVDAGWSGELTALRTASVAEERTWND